MEQRRNDYKVESSLFSTIATKSQTSIPPSAIVDLIIATITLKYTQSNSICYAYRGSTTGIGAGQQSRIHCTRLAGDKSDNWWLRFHPTVLGFKFKKGTKRADKANCIDVFVNGEIFKSEEGSEERKEWEGNFEENEVPKNLSEKERKEWGEKLKGVSLASDAFFPFSDNVRRAARSGVSYIAGERDSHEERVETY